MTEKVRRDDAGMRERGQEKDKDGGGGGETERILERKKKGIQNMNE